MQIGPNLSVPGKTVIFLGVKSVAPFSTLKMRKSKKNEHVYTHTHTRIRKYAMVGPYMAPPSPIGLIYHLASGLNSATFQVVYLFGWFFTIWIKKSCIIVPWLHPYMSSVEKTTLTWCQTFGKLQIHEPQ